MALDINYLDHFIGKKIRFFRKKRRWGLKFLASKINISIQQLQKYETSVNKISASLLFKIADIFGLSIESFFQGIDKELEDKKEQKSNFNILLIEDDISHEFIIRKTISNLPAAINLYSVHDGCKALEFLKNFNHDKSDNIAKPDIIIVELHLPKFSGLEFLKTIKRDRQLHSIPVVVITEGSTQDETLLSYNLQVNSLIVKSSAPEEFQEQIHKTLSYWTELVRLPN